MARADHPGRVDHGEKGVGIGGRHTARHVRRLAAEAFRDRHRPILAWAVSKPGRASIAWGAMVSGSGLKRWPAPVCRPSAALPGRGRTWSGSSVAAPGRTAAVTGYTRGPSGGGVASAGPGGEPTSALARWRGHRLAGKVPAKGHSPRCRLMAAITLARSASASGWE